jgi:hypothetical protein
MGCFAQNPRVSEIETNDLDKLNLDKNFIRTDINVKEEFNFKPNFLTFAGTRFSSRERYCSIRE